MKVNLKTIFISLVLTFTLFGCSSDSAEEPDPTLTAIQSNIFGNWVSTDTSAGTEGIWQFLPDGTFIDTRGGSFQYEIYQIEGFYYVAFNAEDLNIEPSEELKEEMEDALGNTDFIPIYQVSMPSSGSLIIEPAIQLYQSDSYFGFTFQTYVLRRQ